MVSKTVPLWFSSWFPWAGSGSRNATTFPSAATAGKLNGGCWIRATARPSAPPMPIGWVWPVIRFARVTTWSVASPSPFRSCPSIASSFTKTNAVGVSVKPSRGTGSSALARKLPHCPPGQLLSSVQAARAFAPPMQAPRRSTTGPTPSSARSANAKSEGPHSPPGQSVSVWQGWPARPPRTQLASPQGAPPQSASAVHGAPARAPFAQARKAGVHVPPGQSRGVAHGLPS